VWSFVKVAHDLNGSLIADRPECHKQVLRAGLDKASAQAHDSFSGSRFAAANEETKPRKRNRQ